MGSGRSGLFHGTRGGKSSIDNNVHRMSKMFPLTQQGYFGSPGKNSGVRVIYSSSPMETAKEFYSQIRKGGHEENLTNGHGK